MGSPSPQYGLPFDRNSLRYKAFCAKRRFTLKEFACLLAGLDPVSFDDSFKSMAEFETKVGSFLRLLEEEARETETLEEGEDLFFRSGYSFCGFEDNAAHEYPVIAFFKFCKSRNIPFPLEEQCALTYTIGEAVAGDTLPAAPVLPDVVPKELGLDGGAQSVVTPAAETASKENVPHGVTEIGGITVAQLDKALNSSQALKDVVLAFTEFLAIEEMARPTAPKSADERKKGLLSRLAPKAKEHGWTRNGNKLSGAQTQVLAEILLGKNLGGAGNKNT